MSGLLSPLAALLCLALLTAATPLDHAGRIASLIDRSKLATLGQRAANPRVQKAVYWLAMARAAGEKPADVLDRAVAVAGYKALAATLTRDALLRNLDIAEKLGCLDPAGLSEMRHGHAPNRSCVAPTQATNSPSTTLSHGRWCPSWTTSLPTWSRCRSA